MVAFRSKGPRFDPWPGHKDFKRVWHLFCSAFFKPLHRRLFVCAFGVISNLGYNRNYLSKPRYYSTYTLFLKRSKVQRLKERDRKFAVGLDHWLFSN